MNLVRRYLKNIRESFYGMMIFIVPGIVLIILGAWWEPLIILGLILIAIGIFAGF